MPQAERQVKQATDDTGASISQRLARHLVASSYDSLPESAITAAKVLMLDTLAVAWGGSDAPGCPEVYGLLREEGGAAEASVWAYGGRLPATSASLVNGMFGAALDYDGVNTVHAEVVALPTALAMAERERVSGKEFLAAFVLGSDLCSRFGASITGQHKGWFTTSIYGVFGAAATAAKLLRLDALRTQHAFGIALSQAAGTQQANVEQALTKRLQSAFATRAGVFSALLAERGITAPRDAFEGKFGLYQLYQDGDPQKVLAELGERFDHANTALKKYPCCACSHAALAATLELVHEHDLEPEDVLAVEVSHSPLMHRLVGAPFDPAENAQVTAQFSVRYAIASALLRRRLGIAEIQDDAIRDPLIKSLTNRIDVVVDETSKGSRTPATVTLKTRKHGTLTRTGDKFPWGTEDPPTRESLRAKFDECVSGGAKPLSAASRELLVQRVERIESVADMSQFFAGILG